MITAHKNRALAGFLMATSLVLGACGTRLDHATVVRASSGSAGQSQSGPAQDLPGGSVTTPGDGGVVPGAPGAQAGPAEPGIPSGGQVPQSGGGPVPGQPGGKAGPVAGGPIVIGSVGRYSGPGGSAFSPGARALQAWAAASNARGGINGRQVKVIVEDDGNDPGNARSKVQELVEQHKAVAIVAAMGTSETRNAWKGYVEQKRIPVIGGDCGPGWNESPMLFTQCPSVGSMNFGTALVGARHGKGKKFGALVCQESDACAYTEQQWFQNGNAQRAGLDPRYHAKISLTQPDYTSECIQARNAGVEILSVAADPNTVGRVAASCRRQNFQPQFLQISSSVDGDTAAKPGLSEALLAMPTFPFAGLSGQAYGEFNAAWQKYGGGQAPGPSASMGWAAAKIFEKAALGAGPDVSSAGLAKQLYSFRNERFGGLTVPLSYVEGKGTADTRCTFFMKEQGGRWVAPAGDKLECF